VSRIELITEIAAPVERVYDASRDIDLHVRSTGTVERAVAGVTTGLISEGETVTWQALHFGVRWRMTTLIVREDRYRSFIDKQVRGPFGRWHHQHLFEAAGGGTRMTDLVEWSAPAGPLGKLVEGLFLADYMEGLLRRRNSVIKATCEPDRPLGE
jgi:ligand-binding SRPBCC domain-containing protein